jgi:hypothetical protein
MKENRRKERVGFRKGTSLLFCSVLLTSIFLQFVSSLSQAATSLTITNLTANNPVMAGYTRFGNIQLNDAGQAVFTGVNPSIADSQGHLRADVFFWDGTTLKNLTKDIPGFVAGAPGPYLNKNGQIVFTGVTNFGGGPSKPYFYNGTSVQNLADSLPSSSAANTFREIVINDAALVAFSGCQAVGSVGACLQPSLFLFNGSAVTLLVDGFVNQMTNLSINASGHIAWGAQQLEDIGFFDGTSIRVLTVDPIARGAGYSLFYNPKLNNADQIIFGANKFASRSDMFFFDGSTLKNLTETDPAAGGAGFTSFDPGDLPALNNSGKAVFVGQELNRTDTSEVFFFDGTILKNLTGADPVAGGAGFNYFSPFSPSPQINNIGQLAFMGNNLFLTDSEAIFFFDGTSLKNVTGDASLALGLFPRINNAGHLAFFGKDGSTIAQIFQDVFFFDGTSVRKISHQVILSFLAIALGTRCKSSTTRTRFLRLDSLTLQMGQMTCFCFRL